MTDAEYHVLDLFCGLGGFSSAFEESDRWAVTTVDIEAEFDPDIQADVFELRPSDFEQEFDVILASPPCRYLSTAGNHDMWDSDAKKPIASESRDAVALFIHTIGLIQGLSPTFYYIENPRRSRIQLFIGLPDEWVTYCQYGTGYQKPTGLWGEFAPMTFKRCRPNAECHASNTEDDGTSAIQSLPSDTGERARVPYDLSKAIRDACEQALDGNAPEQLTIDQLHA